MDFDNDSGLEASVLRSSLPSKDTSLAVIVAKAVGVFDAAGHMRLELAIPAPICFQPTPHPYGQIPADVAIRKAGADVLALGRAYHPALDGGAESRVSVQLEAAERSLRVFGQRYWYKSHAGEWAISEAEPFSLTDMTWDQCFGGTSFDEFGNDDIHPLNRDGKGYIASEEAIEDTPLPNIEHAEQPIVHWQDQPRPCNIAPAAKHLSFDASAEAPQLTAATGDNPYRVPSSMWNDAVPHFRFDALPPGARCSLHGMAETSLHAEVPSFRLRARVDVGARRSQLVLVPDTLLFLPESKRCVFTWRGSFIYRFVPREKRSIVLVCER